MVGDGINGWSVGGCRLGVGDRALADVALGATDIILVRDDLNAVSAGAGPGPFSIMRTVG